MTRRVLVLGAQVPFARGGAENLNAGLVDAIRRYVPEVAVDLVQLPMKHYPEQRLLTEMMSWRLVDLTEVNGERVDLVIATKFPTYAVRHPNKVLWLVHQYRQAYDLAGTVYDKSQLTEVEQAARSKLRELDEKFIGECVGRFAISETVSERLLHFNRLLSIPLWPPSLLQERIHPGPYSGTVICFGRLDASKRVSLLVDAVRIAPEATIVIYGAGPEEPTLRSQIERLGLQQRCRLGGHVGEPELIDALAQARAVFYGPYDEDYGYATIEAFLAEKPVITCADSGEAARIVARTGGGWVVESNAAAIASALQEVYRLNDAQLTARGRAGASFARGLSWEHVVGELVAPYL
ncbi:MAG: glycosyltransferase family 4 protein [Pseudomonadota bacterium]|nr:glycosyltransferase family 4 protein [Pseudomonadota bacterium]